MTYFDSILCFQDDDSIILTYLANFFCEKYQDKNLKKKFCHDVVEAEAIKVEAEAIQKLALPHPCSEHFNANNYLTVTQFY